MKHRIMNAGKSVEIFIYEPIGGWLGGITPQAVADSLKAAGSVETINLRINSPGGDVFDGVSIYNQLKRHPARVEVDIDGVCASIATIVAMAGDKIRMAANGSFMIHEPYGGATGSAADLRRRADLLDQTRENILDTYVARTKADRVRLSDMMEAETWMRAGDALDLGFVDEVTDEIEMAACFDLSLFKNPPSNLSKGPLVNPNRARLAANARKVRQVCG